MTTPSNPDGTERPVPPGGWPSGGRVAGQFRTCAECGDDIWPAEHVYPVDAPIIFYSDGVLCAVCEVKTRAAEVKP